MKICGPDFITDDFQASKEPTSESKEQFINLWVNKAARDQKMEDGKFGKTQK